MDALVTDLHLRRTGHSPVAQAEGEKRTAGRGTLSPRRRLRDAFRERYYEVLASVYLYNEYEGYIGLERLLTAVRQKYPDETEFIASVEKHTEDERKHYRMFKHYFESLGLMPLAVDRTYGYIDQFVWLIFGRSLENLARGRSWPTSRSFSSFAVW